MKKSPKKPVVKKKKEEPKLVISKFRLNLEIGGIVYTGTGETMSDALKTLTRPTKIVSKAQLFVHEGEKQRSLLLSIPQTKRLFYPMARTVVAKQLSFGLK